MSAYDTMTIDEMVAACQLNYDGTLYLGQDPQGPVIRLLCRMAARDALLDLSEDLSEQGLCIVPEKPTPAMRAAAKEYASRIVFADVCIKCGKTIERSSK